jgi:2'-hydroxyisoflavone reductase
MKFLVLGGSVFVGRHVVEAALAAGHEVTVFNRGSRPLPFGDAVQALHGDRNRDADLAALRGVPADAVIDCCGYTPAQVQASTAALARVPFHVFVSTISVFERFAPGVEWDESLPRSAATEGYGGLKARAEDALIAALPGRAAVVRPGLVAGPWDPTGRFTWWPLRVARGGELLAPGRPQRPVQFIDARDLGAFCVRLAESRCAGTFNALGDMQPMQALLDTCREAAGSVDARWAWRSDDTLLGAGVVPWSGLPLWIPEHDPTHGGMLLGRNQRARAAGLRPRPWLDTVRDTLHWAQAQPAPVPDTIGLTPEAERALLEASA